MIINHNLIGSEFITTTNNTLKSTEKKTIQRNSKKIHVQHQTCIFHAIKYIKDETKKYLRSKTLSTLNKMTIAN